MVKQLQFIQDRIKHEAYFARLISLISLGVLPSVELLISYIYIYIYFFFFIYDPFPDGTSKIQNLGVLIRLACIKLVHSLFLR